MTKWWVELIVILLVLALCIVPAVLLIAGTSTPAEDAEVIGYVIVQHSDGDEHVDITNYWTSNGVIHVDTVDGRHIASCEITVIVENK